MNKIKNAKQKKHIAIKDNAIADFVNLREIGFV